ncbi:MAG: phospho-N-acetylmuramoyl-pentapeptide-transferase [Spirochaetia bacterium]|nr:phospho-N-acetylmuramoyl-pentapeptide-transferase [Spirochaetia bacterium]
MFYWLLYPLHKFSDSLSFFRVFGYVTFRMVFAAVTSLLLTYYLGPRFIRFLKKLKFGEEIRDDGPESHKLKAGTPTMGGVLIITAMSISALLWGNLSNLYFIFLWMGTLLLSAVGFWDDYQKSILKVRGGMKAKIKFLLQIIIALVISLLIIFFPSAPADNPQMTTDLFVPFLKEPLINLGFFAVPFWILIIVSTSNAVNLTDGLDGLAIGLSVIVLTTLGVFAYITGLYNITNYLLLPYYPEANETAVFLAALVGAATGFLWYNSYPAEVFMGDTGSLAIGGAVGISAILIKRELILLILGGVFVAEALSVILQVAFFKSKGRRIFKMAPLHHHYELSGWHENKVVIRFWIVGILLALLSLSSLKIV